MPEEPNDMKKRMQNFTSRNVPHFFVYAKDKGEEQVAETTDSLVDKLNSLIPSPNISIRHIRDDKCERLGKPNYKYLMDRPLAEIDTEKHPVVSKYCEFAKNYYHKVNAVVDCCNGSPDAMSKSKTKQQLLYSRIVSEVTATISELGYSDIEVTDILIKYLYCDKSGSDRKDLLWLCYGDIIVKNMKKKKSKFDYLRDVQCVDCGEWFYVGKRDKRACRCEQCLIENERERKRIENKKYWEKISKKESVPFND